MSETVEYRKVATKSSKGINFRLVGFIAVVCLPVAWMTYTFIKLSVSSGIEQVGDYKQVDLKALGNFPFDDMFDTDQAVPEVYRKLDGQKVLLIGRMYVDFTAEPTVDRFQLVYNIANCCFNGPPRVQERVFAHVPAGSNKKMPVYSDMTEVYGTLHVKAQRENGRVISLFDMDVEKMRPQR
jgi:hypothetical protein